MAGLSVLAPRRSAPRRVWLGAAALGAVLTLVACGGSSTGAAAKAKRPKSAFPSTLTTPPTMAFQVKHGDTLTSIARFFGISATRLASYNHLQGDNLVVGQALQIPPAPKLELVVTPPAAPAGEPFTFMLTGAKAMENVAFEVDGPRGDKFKGPAHTTLDDGSVMASYQTNLSAAAGVYVVIATGDQGTTARATYRISATAPIS